MTLRFERKSWAESLCVELSGQIFCFEGSTQFPNVGFFYDERPFFIVKEVTQTSVLFIEALAPEEASALANSCLIEPWRQISIIGVDSVEPSGHLPAGLLKITKY